MNSFTLEMENRVFRATRGISQNADVEFRPAFLDKTTGRIELARLADGQPATIHCISRLPHEWATSYNDNGAIETLKPGVISGFECEGVFYTRDELAEL